MDDHELAIATKADAWLEDLLDDRRGLALWPAPPMAARRRRHADRDPDDARDRQIELAFDRLHGG